MFKYIFYYHFHTFFYQNNTSNGNLNVRQEIMALRYNYSDVICGSLYFFFSFERCIHNTFLHFSLDRCEHIPFNVCRFVKC